MTALLLALFSCFCALLMFSLQETAAIIPRALKTIHRRGYRARRSARSARRKSAGGALAAPGRRLLRAAEGEGAEPAASARRGLRGQTGGQKLAAPRLCETRGVGGKDWTPLALGGF